MMMSLDLIDGIKWSSPYCVILFYMREKKWEEENIFIGSSHSVFIG
jgi:hypothetical protein